MRKVYLLAGIALALLIILNVPRSPWIPHEAFSPIGLFRGVSHGMIGFSYVVTWLLIVGGLYQLWLGLLYWDMDTAEGERWQYILRSGGTARLLWTTGAISLGLGIWYAVFTYGNDHYIWPCGIASTIFCLLDCWLFWLAFPLYEQVGIDKDEM